MAVPPAPGNADTFDDALPQTQCTRCGYPDCRAYANAIAAGDAEINQCPPGGQEGIARLAEIAGRSPIALNPANGTEGPRRLALIDEAWCIGCTLCLDACPVDCIVGGPKQMHTVIAPLCTGCELCLPACPVDCITLVPAASGERTGWAAWSREQADGARARYAWHRERSARDRREREERLAAHGHDAAGSSGPGHGDHNSPP
ncbi:MAG TPA: electron transport complex subunit RsxB [Burkholderiaceae bacterium]|nr:electron transport complex subunit RsxB [Burkholderiaceae bacterium]